MNQGALWRPIQELGQVEVHRDAVAVLHVGLKATSQELIQRCLNLAGPGESHGKSCSAKLRSASHSAASAAMALDPPGTIQRR